MSLPSATPTPITPPRVPVIDLETGLIDRSWYMFLLSLFKEAEKVDGMLKGPPVSDLAGEIANAAQNAQLAAQNPGAEADVAELQKTAQGLEVKTCCLREEVAVLQNAVQSLAVGPANTPHISPARYGAFNSTTTQRAALPDTAYAVTYDTEELSLGVSIPTSTRSKVYVDREGVYNIQISLQFDNTHSGDHTVHVWLKVNNSDVANTTRRLVLKGNDDDKVAAWNYLYQFKADDYFEIMWATNDVRVELTATPSVSLHPTVPSAILTVTNNIDPH